jgi:membrane-associated phospholipid phosphatase
MISQTASKEETLMFAQLWPRTDHDTLRASHQRSRQKHSRRLELEPLEARCLLSGDVILDWNATVINVIEANHLPPLPSSRSMAMLHVAMYDAVEGIPDARYTFYAVPGLDPKEAPIHASREAAAISAADTVLDSLYPAQSATFDALSQAELAQIDDGERKENGIAWGQTVGNAVVTWRSTDGSGAVVPYTPGSGPGVGQPTPPAFLPALAPQWATVTPFAMTSDSQFRPLPPLALDSAGYATAFNEVKSLGRVDSTTRTADQTQIALFWKDALGSAYAFGHWNKIAEGVSVDQGLDLVDNARLFALLNIATADALILCWDAKYTYNFWRPVTAIEFAGDSSINPATASDPTWTPLIVTPNFPSYTSAHSTVSSAAATILTSLFGSDYHFTAGSDGLPGVTRAFSSFAAAAAEAGQSRIYGGIHYQFDNQGGLASGHALGQFVFGNLLVRVQQDEGDGENRGGHQGDGQAGASEEFRAGLVGTLFDVLALAKPVAALGAASPNFMLDRRGDALGAIAVAEHGPMQPDSATDRPMAWAAHRRVVDQVLADWDSATLVDSLRSDESPLER